MARGKRLKAGMPEDEAIAELHGVAFSEAAKILAEINLKLEAARR